MIALLHPGDLSFSEWVWLFVYMFGFIILPLGIVGFIIYRMIKKH